MEQHRDDVMDVLERHHAELEEGGASRKELARSRDYINRLDVLYEEASGMRCVDNLFCVRELCVRCAIFVCICSVG